MKIVTITGIRPDFIRMSKVFEKLDQNFEHIMIHSGQHYNDELSKIFFNELKLENPIILLQLGLTAIIIMSSFHTFQKKLFYLLKREKNQSEHILFLGNSNSAIVSAPLFKE